MSRSEKKKRKRNIVKVKENEGIEGKKDRKGEGKMI